ncbi:MAG: hypothetical protein H0T51_15055 [Pirellulales bacterium]|nr:hypothetical protein [Pirellulales bacterium]
MYFSYGSFNSVPADNFRYAGGRVDGKISNGRLEAVFVSMEFEFTLHYDGQLALSNRMATIRAAIREWGKDVGLRHDDGTPSQAFITSAETTSGTRITRYPFPEAAENAGNYASGLKGACSFQAEYLPQQFNGGGSGGNGGVVVAYRQTVSFQGNGGVRRLIQEFTRGEPEEYITADKTKCAATQSGEIVQEASAPDTFGQPIAQLWPALIINESHAITKTNEQISDDKWRCTLGWNYQFESIGPFQ